MKGMEHMQGVGSAIPAGSTGCGHPLTQKYKKESMVQMATRAGPEGSRLQSPLLLC